MYAQNQWVRLSVVLLIALLARVALGESKPSHPKLASSKVASARTPASTTAAQSTHKVETPNSGRLPFEASFGGGAMAWSAGVTDVTGQPANATGFVTNIGMMVGVSRTAPLYVGLDLGLGFLSVDNNYNATYIRLTPTALYRVNLPDSPSVKPYFGLSIGPNVTVLKATLFNDTAQTTKVFFEGLTRLGVGFDLTPRLSLSVESKIGILGGDVLFIPCTGVNLSI